MPQLTINIPAAAVERIQDAFTKRLSFSTDIGVPVERDATVQDIKDWVIEQIHTVVRSEERQTRDAAYEPTPDEVLD